MSGIAPCYYQIMVEGTDYAYVVPFKKAPNLNVLIDALKPKIKETFRIDTFELYVQPSGQENRFLLGMNPDIDLKVATSLMQDDGMFIKITLIRSSAIDCNSTQSANKSQDDKKSQGDKKAKDDKAGGLIPTTMLLEVEPTSRSLIKFGRFELPDSAVIIDDGCKIGIVDADDDSMLAFFKEADHKNLRALLNSDKSYDFKVVDTKSILIEIL